MCEDPVSGITITFTAGDFKGSQNITIPDGMYYKEALRVVTEMADWLSVHHYELAMGGTHTAAQLLGWQINSLRRAAGLTQDELAERVGITRPQLSRIETARHAASVDTIADILAALGHRLTVETLE